MDLEVFLTPRWLLFPANLKFWSKTDRSLRKIKIKYLSTTQFNSETLFSTKFKAYKQPCVGKKNKLSNTELTRAADHILRIRYTLKYKIIL